MAATKGPSDGPVQMVAAIQISGHLAATIMGQAATNGHHASFFIFICNK